MERTPQIPPAALSSMEEWEASIAWSFAPERVTWRLRASDNNIRYLKVYRLGQDPSLATERERLQWAAPHLPVPRVLNYGTDGIHEWLLTAGLSGANAIDDSLRAEPRHVVRLLAEGLRYVHGLDVATCPFDTRLDSAVRIAQQRVVAGLINPALDFQPELADMTPEVVLAHVLSLRPQQEDLVVCHGDYCPPNVLIGHGRVSGYVDLGKLGVADRWWDLAIATWSLNWNYGTGWEELFLETYGVPRDPEKVAFYRLLHELLP